MARYVIGQRYYFVYFIMREADPVMQGWYIAPTFDVENDMIERVVISEMVCLSEEILPSSRPGDLIRNYRFQDAEGGIWVQHDRICRGGRVSTASRSYINRVGSEGDILEMHDLLRWFESVAPLFVTQASFDDTVTHDRARDLYHRVEYQLSDEYGMGLRYADNTWERLTTYNNRIQPGTMDLVAPGDTPC